MGSRFFHWLTCCKCKCKFAIPDALYEAAQASSAINFYCPYGHIQHFAEGESEQQKLRRERDRLKQRLAQKDDEIDRQRDLREHAERSASAYKGHITKLKNRAKAGMCPCCRRTFQNLAEHMKHQHPDFDPKADDVVIPLHKDKGAGR